MTQNDENFRLPDAVRPKAYRLHLEPDLEAGTFRGNVAIDLDVRRPTASVVLNAVDLEIVSARAGKGGEAKVSLDAGRERAALSFDAPLEAGAATVAIEFQGRLAADMHGFYKSSYTLDDGTKRALATTQFEAAGARRAFPCFDEPELKATFEVELLVPENRVAISNTEPASREKKPGGKALVKYAPTPVMSTYLLAFIVGDFDKVEGKSADGTPVRVYTTPGRSELGRFALETAIRGLDFFGDYYGIPYKTALGKCDLVGIPDFEFGAMENWGCITFREVALFVDPVKSSIPNRRHVAEIVLHELAHQWFGNLVTMRWWNELWLNESFATFMAYKACDALFPEWNMWEEYASGITSAGKALDSLRSSHPIEVPVRDPSEVAQIFDAISYNKGGSVLRMLEAALGSDTFREGIQLYLDKHRFANASTVDLWDALGEASGQDIAAMMATWTAQQGFPVVRAARKGGALELRQERFLLDRDPDAPKEDPALWKIPVTAIDSKGAFSAFRLDSRSGERKLAAPGWVKLNAGQSGFYLVRYEGAALAELASAVGSKALSASDRYGLIEDGVHLMRAGYLGVADWLSLAAAYKAEENYHIWGEVAGGISLLADLFAGDAAVPKLEAWARDLFRQTVEKAGWEARTGESSDAVLLRTVVLGAASRFGEEPVIAEARRRFEAAGKEGAPESVPADVRSVVFGTAARNGGEPVLDALIALYAKASLPEVKLQLLRAIGSFRTEAPLRRAMEFSLSDKVRHQDAMYVWAGVPVESRRTSWALLRKHWPTIDERYGKSALIGRFIQAAAGGIPDERHADDVEAFFKAHPAPFATEKIKETLEGIRLRAKFRARNAGALAAYFGG